MIILQVMCFAKSNKPPLSTKPLSKVLEKNKSPGGLIEDLRYHQQLCGTYRWRNFEKKFNSLKLTKYVITKIISLVNSNLSNPWALGKGGEEKWKREEECEGRGGGGEGERGRKDGRKGNKEVLHVNF